jgi:hypothetical protein
MTGSRAVVIGAGIGGLRALDTIDAGEAVRAFAGIGS